MMIGKRIKLRREALKMSQRELAEKVGYSDHTTLTRIENGSVDLPQTRIAQFARVLGVPPSYLMGWDVEPEEAGATAAKVLKNPDTLNMMLAYLSLGIEDQNTVRTLVLSLANKNNK